MSCADDTSASVLCSWRVVLLIPGISCVDGPLLPYSAGRECTLLIPVRLALMAPALPCSVVGEWSCWSLPFHTLTALLFRHLQDVSGS